jgi:hypothetical protein
MRFLQVQQGTQEWLAARAGVITASRFSDARSKLKRASGDRKAGDPSSEAIKYAWTLAMERISGTSLDDTFVTWAMKRGTELEPAAREAYEQHTGSLAMEAGIVFTDDGAFGYSTDGFVGDVGMVEIKCPAACDKLGLIWTDPAHAADEYRDQILGGLWITGRAWCDLVVFCPWLEPVGKSLFIQRIRRDDDAIEALESDLMDFRRVVDQHEAALRRPMPLAA